MQRLNDQQRGKEQTIEYNQWNSQNPPICMYSKAHQQQSPGRKKYGREYRHE